MKPALKNLILLIPEKADAERAAVAAAWQASGGKVITLGRFWEPPPIPLGVRVYGDHLFCHVLAQILGLKLISPADDLLLHVDQRCVKRKIQRTTLDCMRKIPFPCFAKPLVPKLFRGRVFDSPFELEEECRQLPSKTGILYCEVVKFNCEARAFIYGGKVITMAIYNGEGNLEDARIFLKSFLDAHSSLLPVTCVADVGYIQDRGWALVEFNPAWGAGLNGCDAKKAILCISEASKDENKKQEFK